MRTSLLLRIAAVSAAVVVVSILIGVVVGDLPSPVWVLVVPFGMLGAGLVCLGSLAMWCVRRQDGA